MAEDVVPEPGLVVVLQLRKVEVGAGSPVQGLPGTVEEDEAEVHEAGRGGSTVDLDVTFGQVPAAGPDDEGGRLVVQRVALAGATQAEVATDGVAHVELSLHHVVPGGGAGVLEVGHEHAGAGVQGVDHHLALGRPGDLHPSVHEVLGWGSDGPGSRADLGGLREEVRTQAAVELLLSDASVPEQVDALVAEGAYEVGDEGRGFRGEDLLTPRMVADLDAVQAGHSCSCGSPGTSRRVSIDEFPEPVPDRRIGKFT